MSLYLLLVSVMWTQTLALDNGLGITPAMGFLTWERFECNLDCAEDPDNCIGERLIRRIGDAMVSEGYKDVGYEYVCIDDCWPADKRDSQGRLQPDPRRFPSGFKNLSDYLHSKGLKFGIYEDVGRHTCAGAPGSKEHLEKDAQTFADWGVDLLKFDGCNVDKSYYKIGYPAMGHYLNKTGRPILYSCEWALYDRAFGNKPNYTAVAKTCNHFRVYGDIYDAWDSIWHILYYYGDDEGNFSKVAAPGSWNDADMITLGNYGLTEGQERVMMSMWCMINSPLLMSVDVAKIKPSSKALLQNKRLLALSKDKLGQQAKRVNISADRTMQVWTKPVTPEGSYAFAVINFKDHGWPIKVAVNLTQMGLTNEKGYKLEDGFDGSPMGDYKANQNFNTRVEPNNIVLVRATAK